MRRTKDLSAIIISMLMLSMTYGFNIVDISQNAISLADTNTTSETYNGTVYINKTVTYSSDYINKAINLTKLQIAYENKTA